MAADTLTMPNTWTTGQTLTAAQLTANDDALETWASTYVVKTVTAVTISANHTFSGDPTFSGTPVFSGGSTHSSGLTVSGGTLAAGVVTASSTITQSATAVDQYYSESDQTTDEKRWRWHLAGKAFSLQTSDDSDAAQANVFTVVRGTGTALASMTIYPATTHSTALFGTSATFSSTLAVTGAVTLNSTLGVTGAVTLNSTLAVTTSVTTPILASTAAITLAAANGSVTLQASGSNSVWFSAAGGSVVMLVNSDGFVAATDGVGDIGTATDFRPNNLYIKSAGAFGTSLSVGTTITVNSGADQLVVGAVNASVGSIYGTDTGGIVYAADAHRFFSKNAGTEWWQITSSGHFIAQSDNSYDIGASGATRPRNVFLAGYLRTGASTASAAPANIGQGTAPSSPNDGDIWVTSAGMFCRANSTTVGPFSSSGTAVVPTCRAYNSSASTVADATVVPLQSEDFDTASMHEAVINPSRVTAPATGYYHVRVMVFTTSPGWLLLKNGSTYTPGPSAIVASDRRSLTLTDTAAGADASNGSVYTGVFSLTTGDYLEIKNNGGGAYAYTGSFIEMVQLA